MSAMTNRIRRGARNISSMFRSSVSSGEDVWQDSPVSGPRILILSASVGSGHIRAATALQTALGRMLPDARIAHVDVLQFTNAAFRRAYGAGYFRAAQSVPRLVGMLYDFLDQPGDAGVTARARLAFERMNFTRLTKILTHQPWDLAINTHFLPAALIARLSRNGSVHYPQATVVTDYDVHGMWIHEPCEKYFLATPECRANVIADGVSPERASVTGIPIDPVFAEPRDRMQTIRNLGLAVDRPIVLQLAGGFGIGSIERIHHSICQIERPLQIVAVAGKNEPARDAMASMDCHPRHQRRILGYTDQMHEFLLAADVVVSKPGGLTTTESLASGCAMLIVEPIPGQEDRNADYLLENGCGIKVNNLSSLTLKLSSLLNDPEKLARMRQNALDCSRPRAAFDIAEQCIELLHSARATVY